MTSGPRIPTTWLWVLLAVCAALLLATITLAFLWLRGTPMEPVEIPTVQRT